MPKIKNKDELVARAKWHAKNDHIRQGTYGRGSVNGHAEFEGCAIGCLATPHTKSRLKKFLREHLKSRSSVSRYLDGIGTVNRDEDFDPWATEGSKDSQGNFFHWEDEAVHTLKKEFGICEELARWAEEVFENHSYHSDAIEFIPKFAQALPEGVSITDNKVNKARDNLVDWSVSDEDQLLDWLKSLDKKEKK